jgi:hypothetical protein
MSENQQKPDSVVPPSESVAPPQNRRPNAGYKLSREQVTGEQLNFHYSRDHRLGKAPRRVRDLYKDEPPPRFSLLRPLIGSRPRAVMFGSIMLICVTILFLSVLGYTSNTYSLEGNDLSIQAEKYAGALMISLKKTVKKGGLFFLRGESYTGAVDIAVSPAAHSGSSAEALPVFYHRLFFSLENTEEYLFSIPFDAEELVIVLQTEKNTLSLRIKPKQVE